MKTVRLPIPPSVNQAYGNRKSGRGPGRYKTRSYKAWIKAADGMLYFQHDNQSSLQLMKNLPLVKGSFDVRIRLPKIRGDVDNRVKPTLDYLVSRQLTDDDRFARKVSIEVDPSLGRVDFCEVDISEAMTT